MKKIISVIFVVALIMLTMTIGVKAIASGVKLEESETSQFNSFKLYVTNANEKYDMYILLSREYIEYAIEHDGLDIDFNGSSTLKYNNIPSIAVDVRNIQSNTYIDEGVEYVQIKLNDLGGEEYLFEMLADYPKIDIMYRVKSSTRDNLMSIENFKIQDNMCKMEYNYEEDTIKTERRSDVTFRFHLSWWQIVAIVLLIICAVFMYRKETK